MNVIVPGSGRYTVPDLYPTWYAVQSVTHGRDPYSAQATREIQQGMLGDLAAIPQKNEQRFAYPLFAVLPAMPLGLVNFRLAQQLCLWGAIVLAAVTAWLWAQWVGCKFNIVLCAAVLAAPPVTLGIRLRQPTLLYLFLLALIAYLFKREKYWLAGVMGALASAKPQLAIFLLGPLAILTLVEWKKRKGFIIGYTIALLTLVGSAFALQPGWFDQWLGTLKAYSNYGRVWEFYNVALLVPVYLWLWLNRNSILGRGMPVQLLFLAPTALIGAAYCSVLLSCLFRQLVPLPFFFFNRAGLLLLIEIPIIGYLMRSSRLRNADHQEVIAIGT
jgi:hypothetical protein